MILWAVLLYKVIEWFLNIPEPNMAQSTFVSAITATSSAFFGLYCANGNVNATVNASNQQGMRRGLGRRGGISPRTQSGGKPSYLTSKKPQP